MKKKGGKKAQEKK